MTDTRAGSTSYAGRWVAITVIASTVLFAPIVSGGFCADATDPAQSLCTTWTRSIIGIDTNAWFFALMLLISAAVAWLLGRRKSR